MCLRDWFRYLERQALFLLGLFLGKTLATYVLSYLLVTFLTDVWKIKLIHAVAIINIQGGAAQMLEMVAASLVDAYFGHHWMLFITSVLYCIGLALLSGSVPKFYFKGGLEECPEGEKICASKLRNSTFYWGLVLIILGKAGQGICLKALTFDKFERIKRLKEPKSEVNIRRKRFLCCTFKVVEGERRFQKCLILWIFQTIRLAGILIGIFGFSALGRDFYYGYMICACVMAVGIIMFSLGYLFYPCAEKLESPLTNMLRVLLAALLKRRLNNPEPDIETNYVNFNDQTRLANNDQKMKLTNRYLCLNKAAIDVDSNFSWVPHVWINCTETQVEETKLLLNMVPMSATFLVYGIIKSNSDTFFIEQANSMNRKFSIINKEIPILLFIVLAGLTGSAAKFLYKRLLEKRIEQRDQKLYSDAVKIGIGLFAGLVCCAFAMWVEGKRLKALKEHDLLNDPEAIASISLFWIAPQYVLIGIMQGLAGDGMVDFYKHQVPPSTKRYGVVFVNFIIGWGKMLNAVVILILGMKGIWFADTVNGGHLDHFYRALVVVSLGNLFFYAIAATVHSYQKFPKEEATEMPHEGIENAEETPAVQAIHNRVEEEDQAREASRNVERTA